MIIVESNKIPDEILDCPLDRPIEIFKICQELQLLSEKENGIGISAVQAGIPWKLFLVKGDGSCPIVPKGQYGYFVNCKYEPVDEIKVVSLEGCLSLKTSDNRIRTFQVERHQKIRLSGFKIRIDKNIHFDPINEFLDITEQGAVFQHETDHHFGILISDIGKEIFLW
jgi:peptide deformylase